MVILIIQTNAKCVTGKMLNTTTIASATCDPLAKRVTGQPSPHLRMLKPILGSNNTHSSDQNCQTIYLYHKGARQGGFEVSLFLDENVQLQEMFSFQDDFFWTIYF